MLLRTRVAVLAAVTLLGSAVPARPYAGENTDPEFKTTHRFTLADAAEVARVRAMVSEFNAFFEAEGVVSRYGLWREAEGEEGPAAYLLESAWSSRARYDEVHGLPGYRSLVQRHLGVFSRLVRDGEYSRYVAVTPRASEEGAP